MEFYKKIYKHKKGCEFIYMLTKMLRTNSLVFPSFATINSNIVLFPVTMMRTIYPKLALGINY